MNSDVMPSIVRMEQDLLQKLVTEVRETVAQGYVMHQAHRRSFGVVDMWNIQRNRKYTGSSYLRHR